VFSVLKAGGETIAVHLGMRTATNLHIWFPAYTIEHEKYSPGLVLLLELAKEGAAKGILRIDFGKGHDRYKHNFKSGEVMIAEGAVEHRFVAGTLRRYWHHTKNWIRSSRFSRQLEAPINATRRLMQWLAFY
jgi:CelD/BcsL family acetyltransferase involved in cellulose biosynthesis